MKFQLLVVGKDYTVALKKMILTPLISGSLFLVEGDVCCFQKSFIFMEDSNRRRFLNHWTVMSYWLLCQVTHSFLRQIVWDIFCRVCDWTAFIWKGKKIYIYTPGVFWKYCSSTSLLLQTESSLTESLSVRCSALHYSSLTCVLTSSTDVSL